MMAGSIATQLIERRTRRSVTYPAVMVPIAPAMLSGTPNCRANCAGDRPCMRCIIGAWKAE